MAVAGATMKARPVLMRMMDRMMIWIVYGGNCEATVANQSYARRRLPPAATYLLELETGSNGCDACRRRRRPSCSLINSWSMRYICSPTLDDPHTLLCLIVQ